MELSGCNHSVLIHSPPEGQLVLCWLALNEERWHFLWFLLCDCKCLLTMWVRKKLRCQTSRKTCFWGRRADLVCNETLGLIGNLLANPWFSPCFLHRPPLFKGTLGSSCPLLTHLTGNLNTSYHPQEFLSRHTVEGVPEAHCRSSAFRAQRPFMRI